MKTLSQIKRKIKSLQYDLDMYRHRDKLRLRCKKSKEQLKEEMIDCVYDYIRLLAVKAFGGDQDSAGNWMDEDNDLFFGKSPADIIVYGDYKPLEKWLLDRIGE